MCGFEKLYAAAMIHDDAIDDRKSEASSAFAGRDIGLEQLIPGFFREAGAIILNRDLNRSVLLGLLDRNADLALRFIGFRAA